MSDIPSGWDVFDGGGGNEPPPHTDDDDPDGGGWRSKLLVSPKGSVTKCISNALHIIKDHPALRCRLAYNSRSLSIVWREPPPWDSNPRQYLDHDGGLAALWIADKLGIAFDHKMLDYACLCDSRCRTFDDVVFYLENLKWDGEHRLDKWLTTYLGVETSGYSVAVGRAWMISAVARAMKPGCKADHMLILEGNQGVKKSSALAALVGDDYFAELSIDVADKDSLMAIHGPWVIEWAELVGHGRRESEAVKGFISRRVDRFRVSYGRYTENHPRGCIFVGTTNDERYLMDPTGGRRYWPVRVGETGDISVEGIEVDRDQLWAESVAAYRSGEAWWLTGPAEEAARIEQDERLEDDPWEPQIAAALVVKQGSISASEVLNLIEVRGPTQDKRHSRRVYQIMKKLGWRVSSGENGKTKVFERVEEV